MNTSRQEENPRQKEPTALSKQSDSDMSSQAAPADEVLDPDLDILAPWDPNCIGPETCPYYIPGKDGASGIGIVHAKVLAWQAAPGIMLGRVQWEIEGVAAVFTDPIQQDIEKYEVNRILEIPYDLNEPMRDVKISVWNRWDAGRKFRHRYVIYRDVLAPTFEIVAPKNNAQVPLGKLTVNGWAEDRQSGVAAVEWSLDGGPYLTATFVPGKRADWRFEIPNLASGVHTIALRFRDQKGNQTARDAASVITVTATGAYKPKDDLASLRAYLEDLLLYATTHVEKKDNKPLTADDLARLFYQPFEQLIDVRSSQEIPSSSLPVNELRAAIEVLRQYLAASPTEHTAVVVQPLAHWKCDETSGTKLGDASGNQNDGTLVNGPIWNLGKFGNAVSFGGANDYVQIKHAPILAVGNNDADFSVTFWMNLRQGFTGVWRAIMHKGNENAQRTFALWMQPNDNRLFYTCTTTAKTETGVSVAEIPLDAWTHVAYVKSGIRLQLYLNGELDSEVLLVGTSISNDGPLYLGKDPWHSGINGSLDDIRIYALALSESSVQALLAGNEVEIEPVPNAPAEGIPAITEADYRLAAYKALLTRIGTSYEEIRLVRGAELSNREALASRLGIALEHWEALFLPATEVTEAKLEKLFGMTDSTREPLGTPPDSPLLLQWRREYLEKLWRDQDAAESSQSKTPIIDPDQVIEDDLRKAEAGDPALDLWQARSQWLVQTFDALKRKREEQADALKGPAWRAGKFGGAVSFSGKSDYVQINHAPDLEVGKDGSDFSVTFWINLHQGFTTEWRSIVHKGNTDAQRTFAMWMQPYDNRVYYRISTASDHNEGGSSQAEIPLNAWTHIAYVKSGRRLQFYVNGELDSEVSLTGESVSNEGPLYIGKDPWFAGINGSMDDIRIYGLALSRQSVQTVFAGEELELSPGPLARWNCDDAGGTKLSDAGAGNHHGTLYTGFDSFVSETLGKSLHELDPKLQVGADIEAELKELHLTRQAFARLLRVRELVVQGTVRDTEWEDVYHILVQVKKQQSHEAWSAEEQQKQIALMPSLFQISETLPQLPPWRATWRARLNWQNTLQARIDQRQVAEDALRAAVSAVEEQTLPLLRDALVAALARDSELSVSEVADWLVQRLLIELKSNASQLTTRLIQAIETVQGVLFALRAGQLAPGHPAATWKLKVDEGHFDEEWQWMTNYSTWRAAMFVFYFPETVLLPSLREPYDASKPFDPLHQTEQFAALLKELRKVPRLTPDQARQLAKDYLSGLISKGTVTFTPAQQVIILTDQHTDETLRNLRSLCRSVLAPYGNQPVPNYLQEIFYGVPMQLSWQLQKSGAYLAALDWLQTVYAYNLPASKQKIYYSLERESNVAPILSRTDHWLTEGLNPHALAVSRTGSNPHTRYTLMSLARCITDFADSEFTRDTAESLARARALYLTAERVLSSSDLDTPSDVPPEATVLPNPLLELLRLRVEIQLAKMRQGRNIAGMKRQVELPVSLPPGPNDLPMIGAGGQLIIPGARPAFRPTPYYFRVLLERSKQLVNIAQQIEAAYLAALEKRDAENYNLLRANNDLQLALMGEELQNRRVNEARAGVGLAHAQRQRAVVMSERYKMLSSIGLSAFEQQMISSYKEAMSFISQAGGASAEAARLGGTAAMLSAAAAAASSFLPSWGASIPNPVAMSLHMQAGAASVSSAAAQAQAAIYSANAQVASTQAQIYGIQASAEWRQKEFETQAAIAEQDVAIGEAQINVAQAHVGVADQERRIAQTHATQAQAIVDFLAKKFTNAELYEWMSGILGEVYSYFLQQATAMAQLAENQLAFERQDTPPKIIQADYWEVPSDTGSLTATDQKTPDRKGLTGSARLLQDIYQLDQYAFETDKRKLNLAQTFSLARMAPYDFEVFRQTGVLPFATPMSLFDQGFPGHYLRLIKRVRVSVIALIPPHHGIRATLAATGISRIVTGGEVFQQIVVRRDPELVALTSPISATGVFEMDTQSEMLLPFESMGVDTLWEFQMPRAANPFDFRTIADVLVTIEYTALHSYEYRQQVLKTLDPKLSGERSYSFRSQFADAWYDLHNPEQSATPMTVKFKTWREDFPPNLDDLRIEQVLLFFSRVFDESAGDQPFEMELSKFSFTPKRENGDLGSSATTIEGVVSTRRGNGSGWNSMIGKTPAGEWELVLPNTEEMKRRFKDEKIDDILLVITYGGRVPAWPS